MNRTTSRLTFPAAAVLGLLLFSAGGCVTSRVEDARENVTGLNEGEAVVIMAKSYHQGNETESDYVTCIEDALGRGAKGLRVIPRQQFVDSLFPWFEPRTAPAETKGLSKLMARPGVAQIVGDLGVRYIVWLDGDTETVAQGGSLSCAAGPGGGGCFGFAWWQKDADYEASVWDILPAGTGYSNSTHRQDAGRRLQRPCAAVESLHHSVEKAPLLLLDYCGRPARRKASS